MAVIVDCVAVHHLPRSRMHQTSKSHQLCLSILCKYVVSKESNRAPASLISPRPLNTPHHPPAPYALPQTKNLRTDQSPSSAPSPPPPYPAATEADASASTSQSHTAPSSPHLHPHHTPSPHLPLHTLPPSALQPPGGGVPQTDTPHRPPGPRAQPKQETSASRQTPPATATATLLRTRRDSTRRPSPG